MKLSRVVVIVAVTAAIVYAGLNFLLPRGGKSPAVEAATTEAVATGEAPAAAESGAESASAEAASAPSSEAPAEESAATTTAEDPALTEDEARRIAANVASEVATRVASEGAAPAPAPEAGSAFAEPATEAPAAEAPATEADAGASELTDDQKRRIAANIAKESSGAADAAVEEETPAPAPKPVPKPAAAPKPSQVATAEPASAPAASAPKAAKPAAKAAPSASAAPTGKLGNGQDVISAWWKKAPSSEHLNLVYVGEASSEKAVVLLFDSAVDAAAAGSQIKLIDAKGASPSGSWSNGSNPRLIAFKGIPAGRYTVIVAPSLADTSGKSVGTELVGPVYVR